MNVEHMSEEQLHAVEERMRCGPHRPICFLGEQERLKDVMTADKKTLADAGVTHHEISRLLAELIAHHEAHPEVSVQTIDAPLECPFEPGTIYLHSNKEFIVRMGSREFRFPGLLLHLVAAHRFFGGAHSPFRLDPAHAIEILRMHEKDLTRVPSAPLEG